MTNNTLSLGVTKDNQCHYISTQRERLLVVYPNSQLSESNYQQLLAQGFRRSSNDVYRPHCEFCNACQSLRVSAMEFSPSKSQRRIMSKNSQLRHRWVSTPSIDYFPLYSRYISQRHRDGSMYPPTRSTLDSFTQCDWLDIYFLESYLNNTLISVAVCDVIDDGLSAVYTFFDPQYQRYSLGHFNILRQIKQCQLLGLKYLYLGFQIDACHNMNYKQQYLPNERYINNRWIKYKK